MNLLQIYCRVGYWKKFENRIIFSKVMAKSLVRVLFFFDSVYIHLAFHRGRSCVFQSTPKLLNILDLHPRILFHGPRFPFPRFQRPRGGGDVGSVTGLSLPTYHYRSSNYGRSSGLIYWIIFHFYGVWLWTVTVTWRRNLHKYNWNEMHSSWPANPCACAV